MTSKMMYVAGMKTESEFADVYLDFIRKCGIPSALRRDNVKSEMSQRVKDIHRDLIIADQWTESHSPWQNPADLNGVRYLKSHAQVLLDRTGAPDNLWFLAQDYLLSTCSSSKFKSSTQLEYTRKGIKEGGYTRNIPYADVLLV
jgi:hypothetical protein